MGIVGKIIVGLLGIGFGIFVSIKAEWFYHNVGAPNFAEKIFGSYGGGRLFFQIVGVLIIAIATLWMTGGLQRIGDWALSAFLGVGG